MTGTDGREHPVLHFAARWLPASEGFVHDLVSHLRRPGIVVSGATPENSDRFPGHRVHSLRSLERLTPVPWRQKAVTAALTGLARHRHVAVVHAHHGYRVDQLLGTVRRCSVPLVLSLHGDDVTGLLAAQPRAYERVHPVLAAVVVPSRFLAGVAQEAGFDPERIAVIPSGIDTAVFRPTPLPAGPPEALFVGRFVQKKGLDVLAAAWPAVAAAVPDATLRLCGFGPLETLVRALPGRVTVVHSPGRGEVRDFMGRARVVVSPSRSAPGDALESLLLVNVEAQASGRPVVTTRHGGIPEFVAEGETALVVPEGDPRALAEALIAVLADEALAARLGAAGPANVAHLDVARTARRMDDLYDAVLAASAATARAPSTGTRSTGTRSGRTLSSPAAR